MRVCNQCHIEKPESEYDQRKDGCIYRICKTCERAAGKLWREANKGKSAECTKRWHGANGEKVAEYIKRWRETNKKEIVEYFKRYWQTSNGKAVKRRYWQTPNGKAVRRQGHIRRRAMENNALVEDFTDQEIYGRDQWICGSPECPVPGRKVNPKLKHPHPLSASIDEIIPYALGGKRERKNCQLMHLKCNLSKGTKSIGCQLRVFG